jgi:hypothetical protein
MSMANPITEFHCADVVLDEEDAEERMEQDRIDPHEAAAGFAVLGVVVVSQVLLILGATHHDMPLSPLAQLVSRMFGA